MVGVDGRGWVEGLRAEGGLVGYRYPPLRKSALSGVVPAHHIGAWKALFLAIFLEQKHVSTRVSPDMPDLPDMPGRLNA